MGKILINLNYIYYFYIFHNTFKYETFFLTFFLPIFFIIKHNILEKIKGKTKIFKLINYFYVYFKFNSFIIYIYILIYFLIFCFIIWHYPPIIFYHFLMWSSCIPFPMSSCYGNHMSSIPPSFAWLVRIVLYLPQIRPIISWHVWTEANYRYSPHGGVHLATIYLWTRSQVVSQKCPSVSLLVQK